MKKTTTTYCLLLLAMFIGLPAMFGQQISLEEAKHVAKNVFKTNAITAASSNLKTTNIANYYTKQHNGQVAYYAFNFQPTGFVVIAADDRYYPVLAFSDESHIDLDNPITNVGLVGTLSKHAQRVAYIQEHNLLPSSSIQKEWRQLRSEQPTSTSRSFTIVGPLTTTKWNQGEFYNAECPANEKTVGLGPADRTYCGCTPVAMAQLIKYHNFPAQGNGENAYVDNEFGRLESDFCSTTYNWDNMPDELTEDNADIAQLMFQMGVAVNTQYSVSYTETYFSYVRDAYVSYFGYDNAARWFYDANYEDFAKVAKEDLDRGLPLLLTGTSTTLIGHTWVADGYGSFGANGTADYFHFNWGWGGSNNGWFLDSGESWDPLDGQEGELQKIVYYWDRYVLHNLYPADSPCQAPPSHEVFPQTLNDTYTYLQFSDLLLDQEIDFRYREAGTTEWTITEVTTDYFKYIGNLTPGTQYEFQGRRKCCESGWSDYSTLQTFTTTGATPSSPEPTNTCLPLTADKLSTSSISENFAYIYTTQPYGKVNNIFRYREIGAATWISIPSSTSHYQSLTSLKAGQTYEFQVTHECSAGEWSGYSATQTFTTEGLITCTAVFFADTDGDGFGDENNTISGCAAPAGYVNNFEDCDDTNANIPATPGSACEGGIIGTDGCTCNASSQGGCAPVTGRLTTSSIGDHTIYVYTPQPNGAINNRFRYRPIGSTDWLTTGSITSYYRYLRDLLSGTDYEFQVSHECPDGSYSTYSASSYFTTTGVAADDNGNNDNGNDNNEDNGNNGGNDQQVSADCIGVQGDQLYVSSVATFTTYIYTPQPYGATNNQFRYRPFGTTDWTTTEISTSYYRYLSGLSAATTYEFQVRHACSEGVWSDYSGSYRFKTATQLQAGRAIVPLDYATFKQLSTQKVIRLKVAPNPVVTELYFQINQPFTEASTARIYSIEGQLVKELPLQPTDQQATINVESLHSGIYLLEYQTAFSRQTIKFIKR